MEKTLKPSLRFKGFTDAWEQCKLTDEVTLFGGLTYSPNNIVKENGTLVLRSSNVKDGEIIDADNVFVSHDVVNVDNVKNGDIIVVVRNGSRSLIGKHAQIKKNSENTVIGAFMSGLRSDQPQFINALLDTPLFKKEIDKNLGATINQITNGMFHQMFFLMPDNTEKSLIGKTFNYIDKLITLHQRKYDKLVNVKKALLDKMFPKNGELVPKLRFKGFTDTWEQRELESLANKLDNLRVPVSEVDRVPGPTPYYGANGIQGYVQGYTHKGEFILVAEDGANDLKNYPVQYVNGEVWVNNHAHVLQGKLDFADTRYLGYAISQTNIEPFLVGGGRAKLNVSTMMKIMISSPQNTQEQQRIGSLFNRIDSLITLHQRKYEKLVNIKKALLQKMFV